MCLVALSCESAGKICRTLTGLQGVWALLRGSYTGGIVFLEKDKILIYWIENLEQEADN